MQDIASSTYICPSLSLTVLHLTACSYLCTLWPYSNLLPMLMYTIYVAIAIAIDSYVHVANNCNLGVAK